MAQGMRRFSLSQWDEWLFPERTTWLKVEFGVCLWLCDLEYPVLLSVKQSLTEEPTGRDSTNPYHGLLLALLVSYTYFIRETVFH